MQAFCNFFVFEYLCCKRKFALLGKLKCNFFETLRLLMLTSKLILEFFISYSSNKRIWTGVIDQCLQGQYSLSPTSQTQLSSPKLFSPASYSFKLLGHILDSLFLSTETWLRFFFIFIALPRVVICLICKVERQLSVQKQTLYPKNKVFKTSAISWWLRQVLSRLIKSEIFFFAASRMTSDRETKQSESANVTFLSCIKSAGGNWH